jgi:signal transduction histidine kinase
MPRLRRAIAKYAAAALAVALSTLAVLYFFLPPYGELKLTPAAAIFFLEATAVSALTIALQRARARAKLSAARREHAEAQLRKENRAHRALSATNEILVRAWDEGRMLREICGAIVEIAGYRLCWVGWAENDLDKSVRPVARAGFSSEYVDTANVTWADAPRGRGPVGTAVRTGRLSVFNNVAADPRFAPWREHALYCGYASAIAIPLRLDSRVSGALAIYASEQDAFDADEVRLLEELANDLAFGISSLRARSLAEQASRAKDDFLRAISHELRTPLTALLWWAQALKANPADATRVARGLGVIEGCARAEARLVDELLEVSKIVSGEQTVEMLPIELGPIVQSCVDQVRGEAAAKGVEVEASIASDSATRGDRRALHRAVSHVLSNALKFTPRGGRVHAAVSRERDGLVLRVRDTGKGIAEADLPHVFDLFRSGDGSTTFREGGLGTGLFVARALVEAHGGSVRAESEGVGRGATLVMTLSARS